MIRFSNPPFRHFSASLLLPLLCPLSLSSVPLPPISPIPVPTTVNHIPFCSRPELPTPFSPILVCLVSICPVWPPELPPELSLPAPDLSSSLSPCLGLGLSECDCKTITICETKSICASPSPSPSPSPSKSKTKSKSMSLNKSMCRPECKCKSKWVSLRDCLNQCMNQCTMSLPVRTREPVCQPVCVREMCGCPL
jgi:hypothetical protein